MVHHPREILVETARDMLGHLDSQRIDRAPDILTVDATIYADRERFEREKRLVFRRLPLMLAASCELADPGQYKTLEVAGVPVLMVRGRDGQVRAFLNSCTHRGSRLAEGRGRGMRFTCPYHGWSFTGEGDLLGVASPGEYGAVDKAAMGLVAFPVTESAGLIWVVLEPDSALDSRAFLNGFDQLIGEYGLEGWQFYDQCTLPGANWKLAFDAHMDFYHLPVLHRETFGPAISNLAQYYFQGPHQRLGLMSSNPVEQDDLLALKKLPEDEWPTSTLLFGEWIIFPNVSLNCFVAGERVMVISQIVPGDGPETSYTIQTYLTENQPSPENEGKVRDFIAFIKRVVGEEDLPMSQKQQQALSSGLLGEVQFGRNEVGLQQYHQWLERILATEDSDLDSLFGSVP